jgi:hypothetical protein
MDRPPNLPLERQLISILASNREDSYATQRKRGYILKEKHIKGVVEAWKAEDKGRRGIEEKLSHLRWLVRKIGKANLVPRSNAELGVETGPRYTRAGKVVADDRFAEMLSAVADERIRAMMLLARHLGLRFKEAALFRPDHDWQGDRLWVKRGTKGGRPRYLWLHNPRQAEVLSAARLLARGDAGLIPPQYRTYEEWRQHVYRVLRGAGVGRATDATFHDLRRTYLVERMKFLVSVKHAVPLQAAALVAREAGHGRLEILKWYIAEAA